MTLTEIPIHPLRVQLTNELHARPFPIFSASSRVATIAIERNPNEVDADVNFLKLLLDKHGASHPAPNSGHFTTSLGKAQLKWEQHTEFNTFTLFADGLAKEPFSGELFDYFPAQWLAQSPGRLLTSILVRVEHCASAQEAQDRVSKVSSEWFLGESLATAMVMDGDAAIAGDFRLDTRDHIRFVVFQIGKSGRHRMGRVVQRLIELETYKTMAMLTLPIARDVFARLADLDREMGHVVSDMAKSDGTPKQTLDRLLDISARVEDFSAETAYRFTASEAYSAIVYQRIAALREERMLGNPLFSDFMMRRFEPAMKTCRAAQNRLMDISNRASRASRLLSTRVSVNTNQQNTKLLEQMDRRTAMQLRVQEAVEGLSVVAISYYGVNLLQKLLSPLTTSLGITDKTLAGGLVIPVIILIWIAVRRLRKSTSS